jgi:hypothetical protein
VKRRCVMLAGVLAGVLAQAAGAQPPSDCPRPWEVEQRHLLGLWHAEFADHAAGATLLLQPHPDMDESVRGTVDRNGELAQVAGDVDEDGAFTLEESVNGTNISATWLGDVVDGSCGREIRGSWHAEGDEAHERAFVLKKLR